MAGFNIDNSITSSGVNNTSQIKKINLNYFGQTITSDQIKQVRYKGTLIWDKGTKLTIKNTINSMQVASGRASIIIVKREESTSPMNPSTTSSISTFSDGGDVYMTIYEGDTLSVKKKYYALGKTTDIPENEIFYESGFDSRFKKLTFDITYAQDITIDRLTDLNFYTATAVTVSNITSTGLTLYNGQSNNKTIEIQFFGPSILKQTATIGSITTSNITFDSELSSGWYHYEIITTCDDSSNVEIKESGEIKIEGSDNFHQLHDITISNLSYNNDGSCYAIFTNTNYVPVFIKVTGENNGVVFEDENYYRVNSGESYKYRYSDLLKAEQSNEINTLKLILELYSLLPGTISVEETPHIQETDEIEQTNDSGNVTQTFYLYKGTPRVMIELNKRSSELNLLFECLSLSSLDSYIRASIMTASNNSVPEDVLKWSLRKNGYTYTLKAPIKTKSTLYLPFTIGYAQRSEHKISNAARNQYLWIGYEDWSFLNSSGEPLYRVTVEFL